MAKAATYFEDGRGNPHKTPEAAIASDIAAALGRMGDGEGLANGIALKIIDKRGEIERAFRELDDMKGAEA
jgi:hypothetical protein